MPPRRRAGGDVGFADEAREILAGWQAKERSRNLAAVTDSMIDRLTIIGPAAHWRERLAVFHAAGVTTPMLQPFLFDEPTMWRCFEALAPNWVSGDERLPGPRCTTFGQRGRARTRL